MSMKSFDQALYAVYAFLLVLAAASYAAKAEPLVRYETKPATEDTFNPEQAEIYGLIDNADGTSTMSMDACGSQLSATFKTKYLKNVKVRDQVEKDINQKLSNCCKDPKLCIGGN